MATLFSPPAARLAPLLRRLYPKPSLLLHLSLPKMGGAGTSPSRAMSSVPSLRLSTWDSPDDPLDFSAAGAVFHPLRHRATNRKRAAPPEVVEVRAAADKRPGGVAEGSKRQRAPSPEFEVRSAADKRAGGAEEVTKRKRSPSPEFVNVRSAADKRAGGAAEGAKPKRAPSPEFVDVRAAAGKRAGTAAEVTKRKRSPSPEAVELPAAAAKRAGGAVEGEDKARAAKKGNSSCHLDKKTIKVMTYNVWFREDLELIRRMNAIGDLIQHHSPDLIGFQEVTPNIYRLFKKSDWWQSYKCSLSHDEAMEKPYYCMQMSKLPVESFNCKPFSKTYMGRELCTADVIVGGLIKLVFATSHLESPCPGPPTWDQMFSKERVAQANESLRILGAFRNVIFCGDMNWDDKGDGPFPLPDGWIDAWAELKPGENGLTYDTKANVMLSGNRKVQKRLDRFLCKLPDFKVDSIEMIGKEAIPGITYIKEKKVRQEIRKLELPVLPSDHFGLVLTISSA
ncbi:unnamed protein product [Urochloa decumbens]|uniref:Endonuclease/exonuclease/phosphatase domain-containing protein n=1 Tax=Urochloa decumbens TaxID=240449 RepID=A0ABC8Y3G2_9POAL